MNLDSPRATKREAAHYDQRRVNWLSGSGKLISKFEILNCCYGLTTPPHLVSLLSPIIWILSINQEALVANT